MKTIIDMAREAGFKIIDNMIFVEGWEINPYMQRFAELVRADERAALALEAKRNSNSTFALQLRASMTEALKLALEALENIDNWLPTIGQKGLRDYEADAITAIKAALAQPVQEPVAWMHTMIDDVVIGHQPADLTRHPERWKPLYKDPTPCQTCQALARTVMMDQTAHDTAPPQPEERNFCPRCGKRTADSATIHTCTPPQENT
jgi:hypothetical protein